MSTCYKCGAKFEGYGTRCPDCRRMQMNRDETSRIDRDIRRQADRQAEKIQGAIEATNSQAKEIRAATEAASRRAKEELEVMKKLAAVTDEKCPTCLANVKSNQNKCFHCGTKISQTCPDSECSAEFFINFKICPECGMDEKRRMALRVENDTQRRKITLEGIVALGNSNGGFSLEELSDGIFHYGAFIYEKPFAGIDYKDFFLQLLEEQVASGNLKKQETSGRYEIVEYGGELYGGELEALKVSVNKKYEKTRDAWIRSLILANVDPKAGEHSDWPGSPPDGKMSFWDFGGEFEYWVRAKNIMRANEKDVDLECMDSIDYNHLIRIEFEKSGFASKAGQVASIPDEYSAYVQSLKGKMIKNSRKKNKNGKTGNSDMVDVINEDVGRNRHLVKKARVVKKETKLLEEIVPRVVEI